ncbi:glycine cleavage system aminomethyltransferase GcvT [Trinickia caryophylli]|uniref:Aminomethyltransferase n=1 Tax=Trinickia caryophylli TaxID=28094 RepID=A0A1X7GPI0_TRICW|nr:glycine cleavage system aminomethyltransferase GcvT [Trinickia caryophylli]PMS10488.1 glycine cleavage system protein T [Trinickia caryophylli]TRX19119.1 glycine cleavage system aminomethyltransferase GcvT [Trinickia caryophylli]WQE13584.1 glycine cleavage system aminomethyltransferase GcvT [Trinickia caryophylli]SMF72584.1 aminomethyltransferase [Trinickia caryophylli]GLU35098.1 aminomethyltransferase [Trinickia caryophylli]
MTELKRTPLAATHRALNARMVDFGGWEMPVNYGSQIDEHHAVRRDAGMFDVSHMCVVDFSGERVRAFFEFAVANNVAKLQTPGRALYSCLLNEAGGVIDDLIVYYFAEDFFRVVVNAGTAEKDIAWFKRLNEEHGFGLAITPRRDLAIVAVQGPNARAKVWQTVPAAREASEPLKPFNAVRVAGTPFGDLTVARTGYTGEDGFEIIVPAGQVEALWESLRAQGVQPCGLGARDTLRLEAGMNLYGQDMDEAVSPLDAGLAWTVDLSAPRAFVGRAALEAHGTPRAFVGLILRKENGKAGGVLRAHQKVLTPHGDGEVTSGTFSPTMQESIAFARVPAGVKPGDVVQVQIRDKALDATVVKLPFVRNGKVLA